MDSPQSIVSPLKTSSEPKDQSTNNFAKQSCDSPSRETNFDDNKSKQQEHSSLGALEVYINQARDIHNICIYQKQDVYAKLFLTCDPEKTISTKIINGGGRNPVFNETLRLSVSKVEASLKCEIWMLSRVRNYLEDQLLGFALVPVSEILLFNGKLEREFSLSSTDLFHSPAGFVQLSVTYLGTPPEVVPIITTTPVDSEQLASETTDPCDLDKIEFPDPRDVHENQCMVEECFAMPCPNVESDDSSESYVTSNDTGEINNNHKGSDSLLLIDSPPSSVSTNEASSARNPDVSFASSEMTKDSKSQDDAQPPNSKADYKENGKNNGDSSSAKPAVTVNIEPDQSKVVQQDIVDMYTKSMQQFTESLAKMKLPMDLDSGPASSDQKSDGSNKNTGSRVFYGSRAFF